MYYLDDREFLAEDVAIVNGIDSLAPGEVAIVVVGEAADVTEFDTAWAGVVPDGTVVGYSDGKGLGTSEGDGVTLWVSSTAPTMEDEPVTVVTYPAVTEEFNAASYIVETMSFSEDGVDGAMTSVTLGGELADTPAVGSPGVSNITPVDEEDEECTGSFGLSFPFAIRCWWEVVFQPLIDSLLGIFTGLF